MIYEVAFGNIIIVIMQDTFYSTGPKFFGTTTKSKRNDMQSHGSMRETDAHQVLRLTSQREWTWRIHLAGVSLDPQKETHSLKSITERFLSQIDTK